MTNNARRKLTLGLTFCMFGATAAQTADLVNAPFYTRQQEANPGSVAIVGRASALDGRTLWFPQDGVAVTLAGIDACELPQWAFDPDPTVTAGHQLKPVPCGPLAKAWLNRAMHARPVTCHIDSTNRPVTGRCFVGTSDLALELLKVGWARIGDSPISDPVYRSTERYAKTARYGMWQTYVLEMNEWRASAVDRTLGRRPVADFNLLRDRRAEISPPFADARRLPTRTDR